MQFVSLNTFNFHNIQLNIVRTITFSQQKEKLQRRWPHVLAPPPPVCDVGWREFVAQNQSFPLGSDGLQRKLIILEFDFSHINLSFDSLPIGSSFHSSRNASKGYSKWWGVPNGFRYPIKIRYTPPYLPTIDTSEDENKYVRDLVMRIHTQYLVQCGKTRELICGRQMYDSQGTQDFRSRYLRDYLCK